MTTSVLLGWYLPISVIVLRDPLARSALRAAAYATFVLARSAIADIAACTLHAVVRGVNRGQRALRRVYPNALRLLREGPM